MKSIYAARERGAFDATECSDPQIEFVIVDGLGRHKSTGVDALVRWREDFLSTWDGYRLTAEGYRVLDDERAVGLARASGARGTTSGVELGQHGGGGLQVFHVRRGK